MAKTNHEIIKMCFNKSYNELYLPFRLTPTHPKRTDNEWGKIKEKQDAIYEESGRQPFVLDMLVAIAEEFIRQDREILEKEKRAS